MARAAVATLLVALLLAAGVVWGEELREHALLLGSHMSAAAAAWTGGSSTRATSSGSSSSSSGGGPLPCEASGFCSLGRTRHFVGDWATNDGLRALLEAVSYKREVGAGRAARKSGLSISPAAKSADPTQIIITLSGNEHGLKMAVNLAKTAEDQGLAHFVIVTIERKASHGRPF